MSDNRRGAPRKDAFRIANLAIAGRPDPLECLVWDLSATGAQIEVAADAAVPDRFVLMVTPFEPPRPCRAVRRDGRRIGVLFDA